MRIEELKKGLWGYKKESIFQYIAEQEETFSKKLLEKNTQLEQLSQQYQTRIEELEAVLRQSQAELSALRAVNVLRWFVDAGVPIVRLTATGMGDLNPLFPNDTPENQARNRRVEFSLERQVRSK